MNKTGYFTHPDCKKHEMGAGHPECPERLDAIEDRLIASGVKDALACREAPIAPIADIELAHGRMHVAALRGLTDGLREDIAIPIPPSTSTHGTLRCGLPVRPWRPPMRCWPGSWKTRFVPSARRATTPGAIRPWGSAF